MGELCLGAGKAPLPTLAECRALALDYARGVIWGVEDATDRERHDALRIVAVAAEDHGHDPARTFPLTRERMAKPPTRQNSFRPRAGATDKTGQIRKRSTWNVIDRFARDPRVIRLRERLGQMSAARVQKGLSLIEKAGVFICQRPGRVEGRQKNLANAWSFGTEFADHLSKTHKAAKSESLEHQNRAQALSDFVRRGLGSLAQGFFASLVVGSIKRSSEATAKAQAAAKGFGGGPKRARSLPPSPSPGRAALDPDLPIHQEAERQEAEAKLAALEAGGGALAGVQFLSFIDDPTRFARRR